MICNHAIRAVIMERKLEQLVGLIQIGSNEGMHTIDDSVAHLLNNGYITLEDALFNARDQEFINEQHAIALRAAALAASRNVPAAEVRHRGDAGQLCNLRGIEYFFRERGAEYQVPGGLLRLTSHERFHPEYVIAQNPPGVRGQPRTHCKYECVPGQYFPVTSFQWT